MNENNKNTLIAAVLSGMILIAWTLLYQKPINDKLEQQNRLKSAQIKVEQQQNSAVKNNSPLANSVPLNKANSKNNNLVSSLSANREEVIGSSTKDRVTISTPELSGSINLKGAVFDDLTLVNYRQILDARSKEVALLSPEGAQDKYWLKFDWIVNNPAIETPNENTIWQASANELTPEHPVTLSWRDKQNVVFEIHIAVDKNYLFSVSQTIKNSSGKDVTMALIGNMTRSLGPIQKPSYISHEGPIGVFDGVLKETSYQKFKDQPEESFDAQTGWFGITDKYWLVSIIPDKKINFGGKIFYFSQKQTDGQGQVQGEENIFNINFISGQVKVANNSAATFDYQVFAGAKKVALLDQYSKKYDIALFDRAVDFGWYYFLTKPFFYILHFFYGILGNYGLAILAMTVLVKLLMFPLANKSYTAIAKIKTLQPKIDKIRAEFKDKKMEMNKEIMQLYKREKVNPASGCLPMLVQIPVFFSLYKVLYLTIDMRHAPFYGWIKDLSAPDPTTIVNLFGLLPFQPHLINIGIWPLLMGLTMLLQQRLNPQPSDPTQAKVMKLLPFILIFVFSSFPAGLVIYWTWSNILSILQQWVISKRLKKS